MSHTLSGAGRDQDNCRENGRMQCVVLRLGVVFSPNAADPHDGGESRGERVAAKGGSRVHGADNLNSFKPHPLQLLVMETSICQHLVNEP